MTERHTSTRKAYWRNERGATAVEFAMVGLPLILLIFAALQTAIIFFFDQALQTATQKAARQLLTGSVQTAGMTKDQFHDLVCANLPSQFDRSRVMVDVQSASSFTNANTTAPNQAAITANNWTFSPGGAGDIVIMRVMYDWPVLGGALAVGLANQPDGGHLMMGTTVFKNEPFQ